MLALSYAVAITGILIILTAIVFIILLIVWAVKEKKYHNGIYTIGEKKVYNRNLRHKWPIVKLPGGSCFQFYAEAESYIDLNNLKGYGVYGLDAKWDTDVDANGQLLREAKIVRI